MRERGIITKVIADRGFAFVRGPDKLSRFIHASWTNGMFDVLQQGVEVEYTPDRRDRGPIAMDVWPVRGNPA